MSTEEEGIRNYLQSRFESTLEERVQRALEVRPQQIVPHHHFTWASTECVYLYRDGYFMATAMATQALNEGLLRFIADRNGIPANQDLHVLIDTLIAKDVISLGCADAMRRILKSFRNDFHHLNPSISNVPVQDIARRNIEDVTLVEKEIFEHSYENGKLFPKQRKYWDIRPDGTMLVNLRFG
ncbi:MAG: hypothetical protein IH605_15420 [Burkholderiales bacterium]|nr:hypothetical protein [Burkholderiales bacterium]